MARIHLIIGPVGAGKSTFALALAHEHRALRLNLDEWMAQLFRPERPEEGVMDWYADRTARCLELIWTVTERALATGTNVVLEVGLIQRAARARFYEGVDDGAHDLTVYVLDAPRDQRRERVKQRNREQGETFSMVVPLDIFELASNLWQAPDEQECRERDVRFYGQDST